MKSFLGVAVDLIKAAIFKNKDRFERVKRSSTALLLVPLITILGGESLFISVLNALNSFEFKSMDLVIAFSGTSSDNMLVLSGVVLASFFTLIGTNLYYSHQVKMAELAAENLKRELRKTEAYNHLKNKCIELIEANDIENARGIASLIFTTYKLEATEDVEFITKIINSQGHLLTSSVNEMLSHDSATRDETLNK
ncbi:MAG: hypothetical protein AB2689_05195 [Candidatus Thiodiazotropha taylori]